jgi:hypothetical protein
MKLQFSIVNNLILIGQMEPEIGEAITLMIICGFAKIDLRVVNFFDTEIIKIKTDPVVSSQMQYNEPLSAHLCWEGDTC